MSRWMKPSVVCLALSLTACGEDELMDPSELGTPAPQASASASASAAPAEDAPKELPIMEFTEADFVESEEARDPFRDYSYLFVRNARSDRIIQRKVKAEQYALDELHLIGIISRGQSSIMLKDPTGFGWVLYTGDYVGKAELVSAGGTDGTEVAINWRVDSIRGDNVVFIREDNAHPDIPPTTRVLPLYPAGEDI